METALYIVWFLLPTLFFLLALWSKLEHVSGQTKRANSADLFNQGIFVLVCVVISVLIDRTILPQLVDTIAPSFIPLGFFQGFLLPLVLLLAAKIIGPSKRILIGGKDNSRRGNRVPKRRQ